MDAAVAALAALAAIGAAWIGPGLAIAHRLAADPLERFVLAVAIGRLLLALAAPRLAPAFGGHALVAWEIAGAVALVWALRRARAAPAPQRGTRDWTRAGIALSVLSAALLVHAVVGRSGLEHSGVLLFHGRDATNDPLTYGSIARILRESGLPLTNPFAGGSPVTGSTVPFAVLAGLYALGVPMLDLAFRIVPLFDTAALGLAAVALLRALGAPRPALALAPVLLLLGGEPSRWLALVGALFGRPVAQLDSWALFGPYLLAFNPIAPALGTLFAALLLLARREAPQRARALVAGLLVGALFEIKLFLWAPALAALLALAVFGAPRARAREARLAAAAALLASLPAIAAKAAWALRERAAESGGFELCLGCLPLYLADASWGSHDSSFAIFRGFDLARWLDPDWALRVAAAGGAALAVALGARLFAIPVLWRGAREPETGFVHRFALLAALIGVALASAVGTPPHHLNAAQFAWAASFGLWPFVAWAAARAVQEGRWALLAVGLLLVVPGSEDALLRLGYRSPVSLAVSREEREIFAVLERASRPGDVVIEPSMLENTDRPSPIPLFAGRPVYLSLLSHALYVPAPEREERFVAVAELFGREGRGRSLAALARSGARFVWAPARTPLRFDPAPELEIVARNDAGTLYRVAQLPAAPGR